MRQILAATFLIVQLLLVLASQRMAVRYFCWAPFDCQTQFRIEVRVEGRALPPAQIESRYLLDADGWDQRAPGNVFDRIAQVERTYRRSDAAAVSVYYSVNGRAEELWQWPPPITH